MLTVFAALSELERQTTRQKALEGIAEAKKRGAYKGRKPIALDAVKFKDVYRIGKLIKLQLLRRTESSAYRLQHSIAKLRITRMEANKTMRYCLHCGLQRPNHFKSDTCPKCGAY